MECDREHESVRLSGPYVPLQDLPVCLPGRWCVDQSPYEARVINLMTALTPVSTGLAVAALAVLVALLLLIGVGVRAQWRNNPAPRWPLALAALLSCVGVVGAYVVQRRFDVISAIYSNIYGEPHAPVPESLIGAWPSVLLVNQGAVVLGLAALAGVLVSASARKRRRPHPAGSSTF